MTVAAALQYQRLYNRLRLATAATVERLWDAHGGLTDEAADTFSKVAAITVFGAETALSRLVASYIGLQGGSQPNIASGPLRTLRGVDLVDVYHRPIVDARTAIANGKDFVEAMRAGRTRAANLATTDITLAQRHSTVEALAQTPRAVGYRRTLTGASCVLCATASTQRYRTDQLAEIHAHCDCGIAPIIGTKDPGQVINKDLLAKLKASGQSGELALSQKATNTRQSLESANRRLQELVELRKTATGARLTQIEGRLADVRAQRARIESQLGDDRAALAQFRKTKTLPDEVAVHHHGELGPVLTFKGDAFTGPADI